MNAMRTILIVAILAAGCMQSEHPVIRECGPYPVEPYWEYTEHAGAPAEAHVPLHLWLLDLEWRAEVRAWAACVTDHAAVTE